MFFPWAKLGFLIPSRLRGNNASATDFFDSKTSPYEGRFDDGNDDEEVLEPGIERYFQMLEIFRAAFKKEFASACGIDPEARGRIYVLLDIPSRAIEWIPGEMWRGPNSSQPYWGTDRTEVLRCIHVDGFADTHSERPHKKSTVALRTLLEAGNSLIVCAPNTDSLPDFMNSFTYEVVQTPKDLFAMSIRALRDVIHRAPPPSIPVLSPHTGREIHIDSLVDNQGRVRGPSGWVDIRLKPRSLAALLLEIEYQLKKDSFDLSDILALDTRIPALNEPAEKLDEKPIDPEVSEAPTLDEMAGIRRIRKRVRRLIKRATTGQRKGILLHGPTGTGKTMLARTIAKETGRNLIVTSFGEWQSSGDGHLGTTLAAMRSSFTEAKAKEPSILFIDEIDSLGTRDTSDKNSSYMRSVINAFLDQMDGFRDRGDVLVVGATNDMEAMDPAILRHGRFGDKIELPSPDIEDVSEIIDWYLSKADLPAGREPLVTGAALALRCFTESASTVRAIVEEAIALAQETSSPLSLDHFETAMASVAGNDEDKPERKPEDYYRTAVHEAGHALAARILFGERLKIGLATIRPAIDSYGHVVYQFEKGQGPACVADAAGMVVIALAGRCAEMVYGGLGKVGFGAGADLRKARKTSEHLVVLGMLPSRIDAFTDERDTDGVRKAAGEWLEHLHRETMKMLESHKALLMNIADEMNRRQDLNGEDIDAIFARYGVGTYSISCDRD
jgi:ATPases of the AAA+ class